MKLIAFFILAACLHVNATGYGQKVTLSEREVHIEKIFTEIKKQTGFTFLYTSNILANTKRVSVKVTNASVNEVLDIALAGQGLEYRIKGEDRLIIIKTKPPMKEVVQSVQGGDGPIDEVRGVVLDENGAPASGVNVVVKGTNKGTTTNYKGEFVLRDVNEGAVLLISSVGYDRQELFVKDNRVIRAQLKVAVGNLDEMQVIAYGTTTRRLNTGNVSTVKSTDIEKQPVANPLLTLQGRVPGLEITQYSGLPGSAISIRIRGQNSLTQGNIPFYVIDGVPYTQQLLPNLGDVISQGNPLSYINPADVESIDVLKDADATAIYGSRAANGAILITTKKGKAGPMKLNINIQNGWGKVARKIDLLNTQEYLIMRKEAIANDGKVPSVSDYDITLWDTTRYTDWQKELIGKTAQYKDAQISVSGGNTNVQYLIGAGYNRQTNVFPGDFSDQKGSLNFNVRNISNNQKFMILLSGGFLADDNALPAVDLTRNSITLPPNAPPLYNLDGSLNWAPNQAGTPSWPSNLNPLNHLYKKYKSLTYNLISNAVISYRLLKNLELKSSFGYTFMQTNEVNFTPLTFYPPVYQPTFGNNGRTATYANNLIRSWIIEPQVTFTQRIGVGTLSTLIGTTFQQRKNNGLVLGASGFASDNLIENILAASKVTINGVTNSEYKYNAIFGRLNYNWQGKYLTNITIRRDGSSRFGTENRFHNFMAAGVGWVFSKEKWIEKNLRFLSYGKIRSSFGTTGNDQVGDYSFLDLYTPVGVGVPYQGIVGLQINQLYNPILAWEETRKMEAGLELGFLKDRILFTISNYRNESSNQLTSYSLPSSTGFTSINRNLDARFINKGWEFTLNTINIKNANFTWTTSFNISANENKLIKVDPLMRFYKETLGHPLGSILVYRYLGVDPNTGVYQFSDVNGNPTFNPDPLTDRIKRININPRFHGGFQNNFEYKGFQLDFIFHFVKQIAKTYQFGNYPGVFSSGNQPTYILDRWQKSGDDAGVQKVTTNFNLFNQFTNVASNSDASYSDASFVRLKNISLSWDLPNTWRQKAKLQNAIVYMHMQNLLTWSNYKGIDPETANVNSLPPLRVITIGAKIVF